ncbi:MAG: type II toxin-antitoxin system RelE/ParE family toxin [Armatimonadetes bacterium]|nr:type II toxin-antitoxin system RelE/ParE family toxin [Armatimonadota bacterium]
MFEVKLSRQAARYYSKAPKNIAKLLKTCFEKLNKNPFIISEPLKGPLRGKWKTRVGNLRIIFIVDFEYLLVKVAFIGPRGDIYK